MRSDDDLASDKSINPLTCLLCDAGLRAKQEDRHARIVRMLPPICGHDVGSGCPVLDAATDQLQGEMNIPAIARDIGRVSISLSKLMAALQVVQMFGIDGEEHAFIEQFEHILDGQAVDPGVEDASAAPAAPLLAAQLYIL